MSGEEHLAAVFDAMKRLRQENEQLTSNVKQLEKMVGELEDHIYELQQMNSRAREDAA